MKLILSVLSVAVGLSYSGAANAQTYGTWDAGQKGATSCGTSAYNAGSGEKPTSLPGRSARSNLRPYFTMGNEAGIGAPPPGGANPDNKE